MKSLVVSFIFLMGVVAHSQDHSSNNAVHIGDVRTPSTSHIPCEFSKLAVGSKIKCTPPDGSPQLSTILTGKAADRIKRFCGSLTSLNCQYTCVGYLSAPKNYGCAANFARGPISQKNCDDKAIGLVPGAIEKLNQLSDKCHELATQNRNPSQPSVVDDTRDAVGVGSQEPLTPGPIQVDE